MGCGWAGAIFEVTRPFGQEQWGQRIEFIRKTVEVSFRLFDIFERNMVFIFLNAKVEGLMRLNEPSNEIDRVSKFDNSLSFGAEQNALRQLSFEL